MKLANGESIVKEWNYASSKVGANSSTANLTITNKRIVHSIDGTFSTDREEIPLSSVKSVSFSHAKTSVIGAIVMIILGCLLAIIGIVAAANSGEGVILVPFLIIGIILVIVGIASLGNGIFMLNVITTGVENVSLSLGAVKLSKRFKINQKARIKINHDVVKDIIDSFGTIIINLQNA